MPFLYGTFNTVLRCATSSFIQLEDSCNQHALFPLHTRQQGVFNIHASVFDTWKEACIKKKSQGAPYLVMFRTILWFNKLLQRTFIKFNKSSVWATADQSVHRLGYGLDDRGSIPSRHKRPFFSIAASRPTVGPTAPPNASSRGSILGGKAVGALSSSLTLPYVTYIYHYNICYIWEHAISPGTFRITKPKSIFPLHFQSLQILPCLDSMWHLLESYPNYNSREALQCFFLLLNFLRIHYLVMSMSNYSRGLGW